MERGADRARFYELTPRAQVEHGDLTTCPAVRNLQSLRLVRGE